MSSDHADSDPASSDPSGPDPSGPDPDGPSPEDGRLARTTGCSNCKRRFVGNYCPECGQEAHPPDSVVGVLSIFFRELIDIEGGLWPTLRALTIRPGRSLARHMSGARQRLMHPGRYLLAAIVVAFTARQVFTWIGARTPYDEFVASSFSMSESTTGSSTMDPDTAGEIQSMLTLAADRVVESQAFLVSTSLLLTAFLSLSVWRLFRSHFTRGAQAVAFSAFVVAHTAFLTTAAKLLYVPVAHLSTGLRAGLPDGVSPLITAVYVAVATARAFGGGWKDAAKGLLALGWAAFEQVLLLGIVIGGYFGWLFYAPSGAGPSPEGTFRLSAGDAPFLSVEILPLVAILLIPFVLHAGVELYYRRG